MRRCSLQELPRERLRIEESLLFIFEYGRQGAMVHGHQAQVRKQQYECWLEPGSGSAGLKMSLLFHMTEHADLADAEEDASSPSSHSAWFRNPNQLSP